MHLIGCWLDAQVVEALIAARTVALFAVFDPLFNILVHAWLIQIAQARGIKAPQSWSKGLFVILSVLFCRVVDYVWLLVSWKYCIISHRVVVDCSSCLPPFAMWATVI